MLLQVINGTTREGRFSERVASWVMGRLEQHDAFDLELIATVVLGGDRDPDPIDLLVTHHLGGSRVVREIHRQRRTEPKGQHPPRETVQDQGTLLLRCVHRHAAPGTPPPIFDTQGDGPQRARASSIS